MPLPSDYQLEVVGVGEAVVVPTGDYQVKIADIEDRGEEEFMGVVRKRIRFIFEITEGPHKGKKLSKFVSNKWSAGGQYQPSYIYQITQAVLKTKPQEPVNPNELIGKGLIVTVTKVTRDDKEFSQIVSFAALNHSIKGKIVENVTEEETSEVISNNEA